MKYDIYDICNFKETITECIIDGIRKEYHACSSGKLEDAIIFYKDYFEYIGSGAGEIYIDGIKNVFEGEHHFFIHSDLTFNQRRKNKLIKLNNLSI